MTHVLLQAAGDADARAAAAQSLQTAALVVLALYIVLLLVLGVVGFRKSRASEEDYYLAGRGQGWIVTSLTIMATFFSSFALLGAPGLVYREGVVFALFSLNVPLAGAMVYLFGSRLSRLGARGRFVTPADLVADAYGSPVALRLLVAAVCVLYAIPYVVMQMNAGGIVSEVLFPDSPAAFDIGVSALAVVTVVYVMIGGMRSVAWTDVIQGAMLLAGMLLAGAATVWALGGVGSFLDRVAELPPRSLSAPGTTGSWPVSKLFTVCTVAACGSMLQPAQWMRYYAARSSRTLARSALIFGTVLPACFLFGVMLVGLGGQALYPLVDATGAYRLDEAGRVLPHPEIGAAARDFDNILVVVLTRYLPEMMGSLGIALAAIVVVAIMAASMSTADSNLHALSAVFTRDVYDRFLRPSATERERTWVGRAAIVVVTAGAVGLIYANRLVEGFNPLALIAQMGLLAIAFSTQLLPVTIDLLFVRKGTRAGAIAGLTVGIAVVLLFTPLAPDAVAPWTKTIGRTVDTGAFALAFNLGVFAAVSALGSRSRRLGNDVRNA